MIESQMVPSTLISTLRLHLENHHTEHVVCQLNHVCVMFQISFLNLKKQNSKANNRTGKPIYVNNHTLFDQIEQISLAGKQFKNHHSSISNKIIIHFQKKTGGASFQILVEEANFCKPHCLLYLRYAQRRIQEKF